VLSYEGGVIYAVGTVGRELFEDFFDVFKPELRLTAAGLSGWRITQRKLSDADALPFKLFPPKTVIV